MPISVATPSSLRGLVSALRRVVRRALAEEGLRVGEIGIVISDDPELRALNRRWRGIDRATDVLSFDYSDGGPTQSPGAGDSFAARRRRPGTSDILSPGPGARRPPAPASGRLVGAARGKRSPALETTRVSREPRQSSISGDLVVSLDRVVAQARSYRVSLGRELARLVIHGALHLAGHDHQRASERRVMRASEERALRAAAPEVRRLERALQGSPKR